MSQRSNKTFADVCTAFERRSILSASVRELEELLAALAAETIADAALRARAREMGETIRQLHAAKTSRKASRLAVIAVILAAAALISSGVPFYRDWNASRGAAALLASGSASTADATFAVSEIAETDLRTQSTIAELARRAPSLRTGTVQAWWAGEQARQVEKLEAQAKRQALEGDREGAARSASRADAIRSRIPALAEFERPPAR